MTTAVRVAPLPLERGCGFTLLSRRGLSLPSSPVGGGALRGVRAALGCCASGEDKQQEAGGGLALGSFGALPSPIHN